ncbi:MAG TPA: isochorismatase family cysteine hydrolase [Solirubrobacteraceae bacterium]|jgi:nicotinamidase-related amidase
MTAESSSIHVDPWPIPQPSFALGTAPIALLIVDMQDAQCRPDRGLGKLVKATPGADEFFFGRIERVIANQVRLREALRATGRRIVFLTIGPHAADGSDLPAWKRRRNEEMRREADVKYAASSDADHVIVAELAPGPGEIVLNKSTFGGFSSTGLDQMLRNWGVGQLVICGQATNVCVYMTAAEAADRGYECVVVGDACAAWSQTLHDAFLENFRLLFGRVAGTDEVIAELDGDGASAADEGLAKPSGGEHSAGDRR